MCRGTDKSRFFKIAKTKSLFHALILKNHIFKQCTIQQNQETDANHTTVANSHFLNFEFCSLLCYAGERLPVGYFELVLCLALVKNADLYTGDYGKDIA